MFEDAYNVAIRKLVFLIINILLLKQNKTKGPVSLKGAGRPANTGQS